MSTLVSLLLLVSQVFTKQFYGVTTVRNLVQPLKDSGIGLINCTEH